MSVYGRGFLLNERIYSIKALRQITTLPVGGGRWGGGGGERRGFVSGFTVCLCMEGGFF